MHQSTEQFNFTLFNKNYSSGRNFFVFIFVLFLLVVEYWTASTTREYVECKMSGLEGTIHCKFTFIFPAVRVMFNEF